MVHCLLVVPSAVTMTLPLPTAVRRRWTRRSTLTAAARGWWRWWRWMAMLGSSSSFLRNRSNGDASVASRWCLGRWRWILSAICPWIRLIDHVPSMWLPSSLMPSADSISMPPGFTTVITFLVILLIPFLLFVLLVFLRFLLSRLLCLSWFWKWIGFQMFPRAWHRRACPAVMCRCIARHWHFFSSGWSSRCLHGNLNWMEQCFHTYLIGGKTNHPRPSHFPGKEVSQGSATNVGMTPKNTKQRCESTAVSTHLNARSSHPRRPLNWKARDDEWL